MADQSALDARCEQYVRGDPVNGVQKCRNKPAPGDILCKKHRASAERCGWSHPSDPAREKEVPRG